MATRKTIPVSSADGVEPEPGLRDFTARSVEVLSHGPGAMYVFTCIHDHRGRMRVEGLTPTETRTLAAALNEAADDADPPRGTP